MNEQIENIMREADDVEILVDEYFCDTDFLADMDPRRVKVFAELLIRECASLAYDGPGGILEHFGVKE